MASRKVADALETFQRDSAVAEKNPWMRIAFRGVSMSIWIIMRHYAGSPDAIMRLRSGPRRKRTIYIIITAAELRSRILRHGYHTIVNICKCYHTSLRNNRSINDRTGFSGSTLNKLLNLSTRSTCPRKYTIHGTYKSTLIYVHDMKL